MFKLKKPLNYLGRTETLLDARAVARCGNSTVGGGEAEQLDPAITTPMMIVGGSDRVNPKVARISNTEALVVYRNINDATKLYYSFLTLETPIIAQEAEVTLLDTFEVNVEAYAITGLSDDKVLLAYKLSSSEDLWVSVGNATGTSMSFGTAVSIGVTHYPAFTAPDVLNLIKVDSTNVIISSSTSDTAHTVQSQIVTVGVADAITYGSPAIAPWTGVVEPKVAILSTSLGILTTNQYASGAAGGYMTTAASFSITGQTIAFNADADYFNSSQVTDVTSVDTNRRFFAWDVAKMTSTKAMVFGGAYVDHIVANTQQGFGAFILTDAAGVTTSTTKLIDEDTVYYAGQPNRFSQARCIPHASKLVALISIVDMYPQKILLSIYENTTTPILDTFYEIDTAAPDYLFIPDIVSLEYENYLIGAYTYRSGGSYAIKVFAAAIT